MDLVDGPTLAQTSPRAGRCRSSASSASSVGSWPDSTPLTGSASSTAT